MKKIKFRNDFTKTEYDLYVAQCIYLNLEPTIIKNYEKNNV